MRVLNLWRKMTIVTIFWRGQNWSALILAPCQEDGKVRVSPADQIAAVEEANNIEIPRGDCILPGGLNFRH